LVAAAVVVPVSFLLALIGLAIRAQFPALAAEAALPHAVNEMIPIGLKGLVVAGFLAAIMSSADTTLISASTILSLNVVSRVRALTEQQQLRVTKGALVAIGAAATWIALYQQGIISSLLLGYTVFVGGVVVPTLASFTKERLKITPSGAMWAILVGGSFAVLGAVGNGRYLRAIVTPTGDGYLAQILGPQYPAILPVLLSLVVLIGVSRLTRPDSVLESHN
jgi:SSS family solute:Na+ symporter